VLTRDEATAAFMADVTGQIQRTPGVCVATLGPGAVNMTLGVANAYLDRSPVIAITAALSRSAEPYATHQKLDLNAVYRPFTKMAITLDGRSTAAKVREALRVSVEPRMGPVHIALPSDIARTAEVEGDEGSLAPAVPPPPAEALREVAAAIRDSRRPVVILGLDLDPYTDAAPVAAFVERLGVPVFVTPKAKGMLAEDHSLLFRRVRRGGWRRRHRRLLLTGGSAHRHRVRARRIGQAVAPHDEAGLDWPGLHRRRRLPAASRGGRRRECRPGHVAGAGVRAVPVERGRNSCRSELARTLRPGHVAGPGLSPFEVTMRLRHAAPRDTILVTDVGSIKSVTSQCWSTFSPLTFFESNGLSAMSYGFAGAMAARLLFPDRPVVCTIGDGGFGMTLSEIETCVRRRIHFVTVVYNDNSLSLIRVSQENKGHPNYGVDYSPVNFAAVAEALGAWTRQVRSLDELEEVFRAGLSVDRPVVIDVPIDLRE
jgi:acetolactate synthase-1/2/3 large subunit